MLEANYMYNVCVDVPCVYVPLLTDRLKVCLDTLRCVSAFDKATKFNYGGQWDVVGVYSTLSHHCMAGVSNIKSELKPLRQF